LLTPYNSVQKFKGTVVQKKSKARAFVLSMFTESGGDAVFVEEVERCAVIYLWMGKIVSFSCIYEW
jgi:hypothetical protein